MGIQVSGPEVIAFLEWLRVCHPDDLSASSGRPQLRDLAEEFAETHLGCDNDLPRRRHRRRWYDHERSRWRDAHQIARELEHATSDSWFLFRRRTAPANLMERYLKVPFRALFLYTTEDVEFQRYLHAHWTSWSEQSGDLFDFYDFAIGENEQLTYTFSQEYIRRLSIIPGCSLRTIRAVGLPCMLVWSDTDHVVIPFGASGEHNFRERFRLVTSSLETENIDALRTAFSGEVAGAIIAKADVFISYSHLDRDKISALHDSLEAEGLSVWFDEHLRAGARFDIRIMHFLASAAATMVAWSQASLASQWVLAEALVAFDRQRLVPVALEPKLELPPPFNAVHTEELVDWPEVSLGFERALLRLRELALPSPA